MTRSILSRKFTILLLLFSTSIFAAEKQMTIEDFTKLPTNRDVQISPDGKHLSVIFRKDGQDVLAILDRATLKYISGFRPSGNKDVYEVHWVNNERLVYSLTTSFAYDKRVRDTGELIGVNIDGSRHDMIFGYSAGESTTGTHIKKKQASYGSHEVLDLLQDDDENILIAYYPWKETAGAWLYDSDVNPKIVKLNVYNGRMKIIESLPIKNSHAIVDNNGEVRFAVGINDKNDGVISYKKTSEAEWQSLSLAGFEGREISPQSFNEDNSKVYFIANVGEGTTALYLFDLLTEKIEKIYHNEKIDISDFVYNFDGRRIVAVATELEKPIYHYLDNNDKKAKLHKMLMDSFAGYDVDITSVTSDRKFIVVQAYSDFNPGDYYLFDTEKLSADFLMTNKPSIDISQTVNMQSIEIKVRDGSMVNGYLTLPKAQQKNLPLVVLPHGGPHYRDEWGFDWETQLLASRGYAVLQINYRGSSGFGTAFQKAGDGEWGALMQDDITDATKAMITRGIADRNRICIYGASYGGYAALMGSVREPDLYQCAIGSAGVYNLPMMFEDGDIADRESGLAYLQVVLGTDIADQKARSPVFNVDKIKADILLIHGTRDKRAPIEQVESLKSALDANHKPYEWLELSNEGHGYNDENNRLAIYTKILDFLDRHIGEKSAPAAH